MDFFQSFDVEVSGASDVCIKGDQNVDVMKINISGASSLTSSINAKQIKANLSGTGLIKFNGDHHIQKLSVECSGASNFFSKFKIQQIQAMASGTSTIDFGHIIGSGKIDASGCARITGTKSGSTALTSNSSGIAQIKIKRID